MNEEQFDALIDAVRAIAHGSVSGPTGLELVAMALAPKRDSVATNLGYIADSIRDLAMEVDGLAGAVDNHALEVREHGRGEE